MANERGWRESFLNQHEWLWISFAERWTVKRKASKDEQRSYIYRKPFFDARLTFILPPKLITMKALRSLFSLSLKLKRREK